VKQVDAAARGAPEEAEQELGHAVLIGRQVPALKLVRVVPLHGDGAGSPGDGYLHLGPHVSPIFRRHGQRTRSTLPSIGALRRERRAVVRYREERLRDLGGLLLEMFRRDRFREDLVRERCEELLEIDDHLAGLDALLGISWTPPEPARCACGAPLAGEAHFCGACGRSFGESARQCSACGNPLPADAAFCGRCGLRTDARTVREAEPRQDEPPQLEEKQEAAAEVADG
jgi:hypothetical protein